MSLYKKISHLIERDFPAIYREDGPLFVEFVKKYYEWMESSNNTIYHSRSLPDYKDVDNTVDSFLIYFKDQYLKNIQLDTATNTRELIKHSLDLYRSKGTEQGIDLFFKAVFGIESSVYYPTNDIFRLSSGKWVVPRYLEVARKGKLNEYIGKQVIGAQSGAKAFVESYVKRLTDNKYIHVFYISAISGVFTAGEQLLLTNGTLTLPTNVLGSLNNIEVENGGEGFAVGDLVDVTSINGQQAVARVASIANNYGIVRFTYNAGGYGYTVNSTPVLSGGSGGSGADVDISGITYTETINLANNLLSTVASVNLNAASYGVSMNSTNANSTLAAARNGVSVVIGSVEGIVTLNPGSGYLSAPTVSLIESLTAKFGKLDWQFNITGSTTDFQVGEIVTQSATNARAKVIEANSSVLLCRRLRFEDAWVRTSNATTYIIGSTTSAQANITSLTSWTGTVTGQNANITANVTSSSSTAATLDMRDTGFGYANGESVSFTLQGNVASNGTGVALISDHGFSQGFYTYNGGFLSNDKKLYDGWYYQDFSYEVKTGIGLDKYAEMLKKLMHVAGTKLFGRVVKVSVAEASTSVAPVRRTLVSPLSEINAAKGTFTLTGGAAGMTRTRTALAAAKGAYTLTGKAATLSKLSATLVAAKGAYNQTGVAISRRLGMPAAKGSYTYTGFSAAQVRSLRAGAGVYSQSGKAATLTKTSLNAIYVDQTLGLDTNSGTTSAAPKKTLSSASGAVSAGYTIYLKRGETWHEDLYITVPSITVTPYGSGANPVINGDAGIRSGIVIQSTNAIIEDIDTTGCGNGIYVTGVGATGSIYRGVHTGNGTAIVAGGGGRLILVSGSTCQNAIRAYGAGDGIQISEDASSGTHTITGVLCQNNAIAGINHKIGNCAVSSATLINNGEPGYLVQVNADTFTITDSRIEGNNASVNGTFNVAIENNASVVSKRNLYKDPVGGVGGTNNINMISTTSFSSEADVFVTSAAITLFGSHIRSNTGAFAASVTVTNSSFYLIGGDGACIDTYGATGLTGLTIRNCAFYSTAQRCVRVREETPLTMDYNDWYRADGNEFFEVEDTRYYFTLASLRTNEGTDANSFLANPQYTNPTATTPNMTPQSGSVCLGGGFNYGVTTGYGGGTYGTPPNIGAIA